MSLPINIAEITDDRYIKSAKNSHFNDIARVGQNTCRRAIESLNDIIVKQKPDKTEEHMFATHSKDMKTIDPKVTQK